MNVKAAMSQSEDKKLFSEDYQRQLQEKHSTDDQWGNTGIRQFGTLLEMIDAFEAATVLDYGCGKGAVGERFRTEQKQPGNKYAHVEFLEYDPGIPGKDSTDTTADILFNTDVLEHIEPDFLDNVLTDMARRTKKAAFMLISCVPAVHRLPDGRNAHLIIEHPSWWIDQLKKHFNIGNAQVHGGELHVVVLAKNYVLKRPGAAANADPASKKKLTEAEKLIKKVETYIENGQYARARILLLDARDNKKMPEALFHLGLVHFKTDDMMRAAQYFLEYGQMTQNTEAYRMGGIALSKVENYEAALKCLTLDGVKKTSMADDQYREALMLSLTRTFKPEQAIALYESRSDNKLEHTVQYIDALLMGQELNRAHAAALQATQDHPDRPESWSALERCFNALRQFDKAMEASQKAVALAPENPIYHCNLGLAYLSLARVEEALDSFQHTIDLDPLMMAPYLNRSTVHRYKKDFDFMADELDKAYQVDPTSGDVHYAIGVNATKREQYVKGFAELEWYWHKARLTSVRMPTSLTRWYGEDIKDKTLLFYADQGIGDIIMMMRFVPDLVEKYQPRELVFQVNPKMEAMFSASFPELFESGRARFVPENVARLDPSIDCIVAATTLPHIMGADIDTLPHTDSYLKADQPIDYKTGTDKEFVIGISWHTKSLDAGYIRSLKLMDFDFLAKYKNVRVIDLQYGDTSAERADAATKGFDVHHDDNVDSWIAMQPFMNQIAGCDLVISIDNTTVHAAGALGVPCWTILAQEPFWRWPISGNSTPWYESLRLFRQTNKDYSDIFAEIDTELKKFIGGDRSVLLPKKFQRLFPAEVKPARTAVIINDTSSYFSWGNFASMDAIKKDLNNKGYGLNGIPTLELAWFAPSVPTLQNFDDLNFLSRCHYRDTTMFQHIVQADKVIINGEGLINGAGDTALQLLYLAYVAKHFFGRDVSIINHSVYPENKPSLSDPQKLAFYHKVYAQLDACVVRDQLSFDLLQSIGVKATLGIDTSVLWLKDYLASAPEIEKTGNAVITAGPGYDSRFAESFASLCKKLRQSGLKPILLTGALWHVSNEEHVLVGDLRELAGSDIEIVRAQSAENYADYIRSAKLVISGFHQACLMAYAAGVPLIPYTTGTNALSAIGLSKITDIPAPIFYDDPAAGKKMDAAVKTALKARPLSPDDQAKLIDRLADLARKNLSIY